MTVAGPSQPVPARARPGDAPVLPSGWQTLVDAMRAAALVVVVVLVGAAGHAVADRAVPEPRLLLAGTAIVAAGALAVRGHALGVRALTTLLLAGQGVLHVVLALCHLDPSSPVGAVVHRWLCPADLRAVGWSSDPLLVLPGPHRPPGPGHAAAGSPSAGFLAHVLPSPAMLAAHVLVALVLAWWLTRGGTAIRSALAHAGCRACAVLRERLTVATTIGRPASRPVAAVGPLPLRGRLLSCVHRLRGPPRVRPA